ncbi:unnamed protein product [Prorocentrum cordatum]|uniref:Solute carrier family 40 protein n=1 Tax=Prorocentrum cordatum TaxID=2364126 RepID=A0ABN9WQ81_9DINO|nr:unnamed protein product [Polarella glacialis]
MASLSGAFQLASGVFLIMETVHRLAQERSNKSRPVLSVEHNLERPVLKERCFREQVLSPEYLVMVTYFALAALQAQFGLQSLGVQFQLMGIDSAKLVLVFNVVFSFAWAVTPLIGHAIDTCGTVRVLIFTNTLLFGTVADPLIGALEVLQRRSRCAAACPACREPSTPEASAAGGGGGAARGARRDSDALEVAEVQLDMLGHACAGRWPACIRAGRAGSCTLCLPSVMWSS